MKNRLVLSLCAFLLISCGTSPSSQLTPSPIQSQATSQTEPLQTEASDFMIQSARRAYQIRKSIKYKQPLKQLLTFIKKKWHDHLRHPDHRKIPNLNITDVQLTETGESVFGENAAADIKATYSEENFVFLSIKGEFKKRKNDFKLENFLFELEDPLIHQTFVGKEPKARVLLDNSILIDVIEVSDTEIKARLNTQGVPDFYLMGLHKLNVEFGNYFTDALIQFGEPQETTANLQPEIDSVEVLRNDQGVPLHVKLTGKNMMVYPKFSYGTIDGEFGFGYQTEVTSDGTWETIVHIPNPNTFDDTTKHTMVYATPFGVAFKEFTEQAGQ